jgi:hypothetical protein
VAALETLYLDVAVRQWVGLAPFELAERRRSQATHPGVDARANLK